MKIDLNPNEQVIKVGEAKHLNGDKTQGKLIVTNQRVCFKCHDELTGKVIAITPDTIREVLPFKTSWLSSNGLNIVTKEGREWMFIVKGRSDWEKLINRMY
jgi:hypothetical protein